MLAIPGERGKERKKTVEKEEERVVMLVHLDSVGRKGRRLGGRRRKTVMLAIPGQRW